MLFFKKLLLSFFVFCFFLLLLEIFLRLFKPQITFSEAQKYSFSCYEKDLLLPFSLKKNKKCKMIDYFGDFETFATVNSLGYRGKEFKKEKEKETTRILVLGDSITFGIGVPDQAPYPERLEAILRREGKKIEVINAGYAGGFSPDSFFLYFKERGLKLRPDIVILGFFVWNDITDLSETVWEKEDAKGLPEKISSCCRMVDEGILRNKVLEFKYRYPFLRESHLFLHLVEIFKKKFGLFQPASFLVAKRDKLQGCILRADCWDNFREEEEKVWRVISEMKNLTRENRIFFLVVLFPVDYQLYPEMGAKYGSTLYPEEKEKDFVQKKIGEKLNALGISFLDLYPVYDRQRERGYPFFLHDAHLNALGHEIAAEEIAKKILANFFKDF